LKETSGQQQQKQEGPGLQYVSHAFAMFEEAESGVLVARTSKKIFEGFDVKEAVAPSASVDLEHRLYSMIRESTSRWP
jgi:hypothetical protein